MRIGLKELNQMNQQLSAVIRRMTESNSAINTAIRTITTETNKIDKLKDRIGYSESKADKNSCSNCLNRQDCPIANIGMVCDYLEVEW